MNKMAHEIAELKELISRLPRASLYEFMFYVCFIMTRLWLTCLTISYVVIVQTVQRLICIRILVVLIC